MGYHNLPILTFKYLLILLKANEIDFFNDNLKTAEYNDTNNC